MRCSQRFLLLRAFSAYASAISQPLGTGDAIDALDRRVRARQELGRARLLARQALVDRRQPLVRLHVVGPELAQPLERLAAAAARVQVELRPADGAQPFATPAAVARLIGEQPQVAAQPGDRGRVDRFAEFRGTTCSTAGSGGRRFGSNW